MCRHLGGLPQPHEAGEKAGEEGLGLCWGWMKGPPLWTFVHSERCPCPPGAGLHAERPHLPWTSKSPQLGGTDRQAGSSGPPHVVAAPWELDEMRSRSRWPGQTSLRCHTGSHILRTERSLPKWGDPSWGPGRWTAPSGVLPPGWMAPQHSVEPPCPPGVFQQHVLLTLSPMCLLDPSSQSWLILAPQLALVCPLSPPECPIKGPLLVSLPGVIKF